MSKHMVVHACNTHHAPIPDTGKLLFMSTCAPNCARTSLRHIYPAHILASSTEHKRLDKALKAEALCIAINRKAQPLPRLMRQDIFALAEHSEQVDRDGKLAATLAVVETLDTKEARRCLPRAHAPLSALSC